MNPLKRIMDAKIFNIVSSTRYFSSIINRERDRSDRTGQGFSLVIFEVGNGKNRSDSVRNLVPILTHRIRSTDAIGWLEDGRIGVILPHTTTESAWKFVTNVRIAFNGNTPPECVVYAYPSSWIPGDKEFPPQDSRSRRKMPGQEEIDASESRSSCLPPEDRTRPIDALESDVLFQIPLWKRAVDITGSILALILLSPLLLVVPILIKIVSPGPALFRQERIGYRGKVFTIWKFRTMHVNADPTPHRDYVQELINNENILTKLDDVKDRRIIPFGNLLRATGIDELPQLINVFLGDMSLVGPRPCLPYEVQEFSPWQMRRFDTVPGLTGLWQVSGKNRTTFKEMMRLDIGYAKKRAFLLDMIIFLKTIPAIVRQVADQPSVTRAQTKDLSAVTRLGAMLLAFLAVHAARK
jgi:lipopolysaccharide/colanic/teichoic acid biosynthesis glycosyltransferase